LKTYDLIPSIIELQSNVEYIPTFQLGEHLFFKDFSRKGDSLVKVRFKVASKVIDDDLYTLTHLTSRWPLFQGRCRRFGIWSSSIN